MCQECHEKAVVELHSAICRMIAEQNLEPYAVVQAAFRCGVYALAAGTHEMGPWSDMDDPEGFIEDQAEQLVEGYRQIVAQKQMRERTTVDYSGEA